MIGDRLAERVTVLVHAPTPVLQRALAAVAAAHALDDRGRCVCRPAAGRGCPTRQALWTAIAETHSARVVVR